MIPREILKKIRQIELRTNRLVTLPAITGFQDFAVAPSTGGAPSGSPLREPWESASEEFPAPSGATDFPPRCSFAPAGADDVCSLTHGSRRGLPSGAAPQLAESGSRVLQPRSVSTSRNSKPLEFDRFSNCGEFATIKCSASRWANLGFNSLEFDGIRNQRKP